MQIFQLKEVEKVKYIIVNVNVNNCRKKDDSLKTTVQNI